MATLVLLNGPPASGKSTLAARLVETRPLALNLDIDVVRGLLGAWIEQPADAGLAARALAISMAKTHLALDSTWWSLSSWRTSASSRNSSASLSPVA